MTMLADPVYVDGGPALHLAECSPDGKKFVVVLRKGNLDNNTNEFSLILWNTKDISHETKPEVLLNMASSSNREAIAGVKWLQDNETVSFLGSILVNSDSSTSFNLRTRDLRKLTNHRTSLLSYSISDDGHDWAYLAEPPDEDIWNENNPQARPHSLP